SGIYYFENDIVVTAGANVVVGDGAVPGCTSSQEAVFYAENVPSTHNLSGLGGTWVLGDSARILVDNAAGDVTLRFNTRYASPDDPGDAPSQDVSIITVNGDLQADGVTGTSLDVPGAINVPLSKVGAEPADPADIVYATEQDYVPSKVTPKPSVAEAPVNATATRYRYGAVVQWGAPSFDGGSQVTGYRVTASSNGSTCTTNGALTCAINGLPTGGTTFSVVALNAAGESEPSVPSPSVSISSSGTALGVSAAPTPPTATAYTGNVVRVAWATPGSNAPIQSYTVTATPGGATCTVVMTGSFTPENKCDIVGLDPNTAYRFTVTATNTVGTSAPSGNSAPMTISAAGTLIPAPTLPAPPVYVPVTPALIDMQLGGPGTAMIEIPGYVSVPQGRFNVANPNGQSVRVAGGVLAAQIDVDDTRAAPPIGFVDTIAQRKLKIVSVSSGGGETSTAVVQINQNGAYAVNSWEVQ
ncbi:MAG: fibronectin type III domain-containing protein, partial [Ilumatobacteraceae bacterium]